MKRVIKPAAALRIPAKRGFALAFCSFSRARAVSVPPGPILSRSHRRTVACARFTGCKRFYCSCPYGRLSVPFVRVSVVCTWPVVRTFEPRCPASSFQFGFQPPASPFPPKPTRQSSAHFGFIISVQTTVSTRGDICRANCAPLREKWTCLDITSDTFLVCARRFGDCSRFQDFRIVSFCRSLCFLWQSA